MKTMFGKVDTYIKSKREREREREREHELLKKIKTLKILKCIDNNLDYTS